jgi:hypothetical protein
VDWAGHGEWVPLTRVDVADEDNFVAYSGLGPLVLEDRMRVRSRSFDGTVGEVVVDKLGPVLTGQAICRVHRDGAGTVITWHETVTVPYLPRVLAPVVGAAAAAGFSVSLRQMARHARRAPR